MKILDNGKITYFELKTLNIQQEKWALVNFVETNNIKLSTLEFVWICNHLKNMTQLDKDCKTIELKCNTNSFEVCYKTIYGNGVIKYKKDYNQSNISIDCNQKMKQKFWIKHFCLLSKGKHLINIVNIKMSENKPLKIIFKDTNKWNFNCYCPQIIE